MHSPKDMPITSSFQGDAILVRSVNAFIATRLLSVKRTGSEKFVRTPQRCEASLHSLNPESIRIVSDLVSVKIPPIMDGYSPNTHGDGKVSHPSRLSRSPHEMPRPHRATLTIPSARFCHQHCFVPWG